MHPVTNKQNGEKGESPSRERVCVEGGSVSGHCCPCRLRDAGLSQSEAEAFTWEERDKGDLIVVITFIIVL